MSFRGVPYFLFHPPPFAMNYRHSLLRPFALLVHTMQVSLSLSYSFINNITLLLLDYFRLRNNLQPSVKVKGKVIKNSQNLHIITKLLLLLLKEWTKYFFRKFNYPLKSIMEICSSHEDKSLIKIAA